MDEKKAIAAVQDFLAAMDIDLAEEGMERTPERVVKLYEYLFSGRGKATASLWGELFPTPARGIIAVRQIPFYSMCEHHLVPFFGEVQIAYIPREGRVAGFSKFMKLVELIAHRPQLQERFTRQLTDAVQRDLAADGVLVIVEAQQLCMTMRGDAAPGARTVTSESVGCLASGTRRYQEAWLLLMKGGKDA